MHMSRNVVNTWNLHPLLLFTRGPCLYSSFSIIIPFLVVMSIVTTFQPVVYNSIATPFH